MTEEKFKRHLVRSFHFASCEFNPHSGEVKLVYALDPGPQLVETLKIPGAPFKVAPTRQKAVDHALRLLHLIAGVSYFKTAVPKEIRIDSYGIDVPTARLLESIYENGLGEFAYRNGLSLRGKIKFPVQAPNSPAAPALGLHEGALVAIGGGKDSLVSIETLRASEIEQTLCWVGNSPLIQACAEKTLLPCINVERKLAPGLFALNQRGALNGHIPVTAVNSAILVLVAMLRGVDQVVFSNEASASYGSLIPGTGEVNHQWSKGWEFERQFAAHLKHYLAEDFYYYSLLRPYSELAIAKQFARSDKYDAHFSSCNRNFHLLGDKPAQRWCGVCPKCHFVFLALAPFMPKPRLMAIFGRNLLDDIDLAPAFDALLEYGDHKPFECVGEGRESRAAMAALSELSAWREDVLVERFAREIAPQLNPDDLALEPLLLAQEEDNVLPGVRSRLRAHFNA